MTLNIFFTLFIIYLQRGKEFDKLIDEKNTQETKERLNEVLKELEKK